MFASALKDFLTRSLKFNYLKSDAVGVSNLVDNLPLDGSV